MPAGLVDGRSMAVVAIAGQKGGSGKTTTAIAVAGELVAGRKRVLLVDADPQGTARTWGEVAAEAGHPAPTIVAMGAGLHRPDQLPALARNYDWTVIDCPPRHGEIQRAALMVANLAVLPCGPAAVDAWALSESLDMVREAQALRPKLRAAVLITRKLARTAIGSSARQVLSSCGLPLLRTELGHRVIYQEAPAAGLGVTAYAPSSQAASEVRRLVAEILALCKERHHA